MQDTANPKIKIRLETDAKGHPEVIEADKLRHYKVVFEVEDAPDDTYAATFELDPSYYDPIRMLSPDKPGRFRLETTAYGDFPLVVRLHRPKTADLILKEGVARGLKRARDGMPANQEIDEAVKYIAAH